jgi:hypothetical protein
MLQLLRYLVQRTGGNLRACIFKKKQKTVEPTSYHIQEMQLRHTINALVFITAPLVRTRSSEQKNTQLVKHARATVTTCGSLRTHMLCVYVVVQVEESAEIDEQSIHNLSGQYVGKVANCFKPIHCVDKTLRGFWLIAKLALGLKV